MQQKLTLNRLQDLLDKASQLQVAVFGDFTLEQTLNCRAQDESPDASIQATSANYLLSGAGRVMQLLSGLGVRAIRPFGVVGNDGYGWQMMRMLQPLRCDLDDLCVADNWLTPVTIQSHWERSSKKPGAPFPSMELRSPSTINKTRITQLIQHFATLVPHVDLVVVCDTSPESENGIFSSYLRGVLSEIASKVRSTPFLVESTHFIDQYSHVISRISADQLLESQFADAPQPAGSAADQRIHVYEELQSAAMKLRRQTLKPVLVSLGEQGILTCDGGTSVVPSLPITPPVDRSSIGPAITSIAAAAMACDASPIEAAQMAMLAANVVMHQRSHPALATRALLLERFLTLDHLNPSSAT